jgi:hypothetical protein
MAFRPLSSGTLNMLRPFPISSTLTAIAIGYRNPAYALIAQRALPSLAVMSETFKWAEFPLAEGFTVPDSRVGRKGRVTQIEFSSTEKEAGVEDFGFEDAIPFSDIQEAARMRAEKRTNVDPRAQATEMLTDLLMLDREVRVAAIVQNPANFDADKKIVLAGAAQFSDPLSDPYGVIDDGMNKTLVHRPNTHVMGFNVWNKIKRHNRLIKAVKGDLTEDGAITRQQYCDLFEIKLENLLIGEGLLNTARKGQNVALSRVWGNSIELLYLDASKGSAKDNKITWGFTAELGGRISGSDIDKNIGLEGGEIVRVGERCKPIVCAKSVGYQIQNAVA